MKQFVFDPPEQLGDAVNVAAQQLEEIAGLLESRGIEAFLDLPGDERNCIQGGAKIVRQESEVLILLLLAHERLLRGKSHHGEPDALVDPVIDDEGGAANEVEAMPLGDGGEGDPEQVVLGHHFAHVEPIVKALHPVDWRAAAGLFGGDGAIAIELQVAGDLRHEVRQMIGEGKFAEVPLPEQRRRLEAPFADDFLLGLRENLGEFGE